MDHLSKSLESPRLLLQNIFNIGLRFLVQSFLSWFLFFPFTWTLFVSPEEWGHNESLLAVYEIVKLITITGSISLITKIADEENLERFGLKKDGWAIIDFLVGLLITFVVLGFNFFMLLWLGVIHITDFAWEKFPMSYIFLYTMGTFLIFTFVGWSEELLSRGFHLQTIGNRINKFWGVLVSSIIFSYLHRNNPDMDTLGLIFIFFAGLMLAYAYLKTNKLWLSIGLHTGWDFFLVVVFYGIPIGRLKIFHLIDVISNSSSSLVFYITEYLALILCTRFIYTYSRSRD